MYKQLGRVADKVKNIGATIALNRVRHISSLANQVAELVMPDIHEFSRRSQQFLKQHGNKIIKTIQACREPLSYALQSIVSGLGGYSLAEAKKEQDIDKFVHTFMRITIDDGTEFMYEKNERPHFTIPPKGIGKNEESINVPITRQVSLADMCENAIRAVGKMKYFKYNPLTANCQEFLIDNIKSSWPETPPNIITWIDQNASQLQEHLPEVAQDISKNLVNIYNKISTK